MLLVKALHVLFSATWATCTIAGINYMDPINIKALETTPSEDQCNPLYWYPRDIPEYCYIKKTLKPGPKPVPVPMPIHVPLPSQSLPMPPIFPMSSFPMSPAYPIATMPFQLPPQPVPIFSSSMPLPYGVQLAPTNPMLPVAGVPEFSYPSSLHFYRPQQQVGMVPGIPGLVTHDGGINILPFSDAYADLLKNHKRRMGVKKMNRVIDGLNEYPRRRKHRY